MRLPRLAGDYYRPNSGDGFEATPLPPNPPVYQRPYTHEDDVTIRLRRCQAPLPNTGSLWRKTPRRLRVEPLELEIAQSLPDLCPGHGLPAVSRNHVRASFYDTELHPRFHRTARERDLGKNLFTGGVVPVAPVSTILVGEWPVCDRCVRTSGRYRWAARSLLWLMVANLVAVVIVSVAHVDPLLIPLVLALFPGSIPLGLVVVIHLFGKSAQRVTYRPICDERFAFVQAHPRFRAAIEQDPRYSPSLDKEPGTQ
ncbi:hypothetical protein ACQP2U_05310 [Nocardia sp. CA-084685]|uniref:hypothetical protein n=1 Tax=Nocardia sp. CA-084685 TaxID=3239970 RepID=UPI003D993053